jgi:hypothetical protein
VAGEVRSKVELRSGVPGIGLSVWSGSPDRGGVQGRRAAETDRTAERGHHRLRSSTPVPGTGV